MELHILNIDSITQEMQRDVAERMPLRYARSQQFKFPNDALRCIGVGVLLLKAFPNLKESDLQTNEHGKLFLENECEFNVSHSGSYVVLATDSQSVGVDIEQIRERHFRVATKVFTPEEIQWMNKDVLHRFFTLWTQKESLVKAVGCGITVPLETISVMPFQDGSPVEYNDSLWFCKTISYEGYMISVCGKQPTDFQIVRL